MKTIAIASLCSFLSFLPAFGADGWMTDFEAAKKKAAAENKSLLVDFTGSDWCPPCAALKSEVLDQEAFGKAVAPNYILVEIDFPKDKSKMSEETIAQNEKLADEYKIEGFPTILLADAEGRPFGYTGYQPGGAEAYVTHLATFREKLTARDKAFADLEKAKGVARGASLETALASVPQQSVSKFYGEELAELSKLNPKAEIVMILAKAEAEAKQNEQFNALFEAKDFEGVVALVDKIVKEGELAGLELQQISVYKVNAYAMAEEFMKAVAVLDQVTAIDPESDYGKGAQKYKLSLLVKQAELNKAKEAADAAEAGKDQPAPSKEAEMPVAPKKPVAVTKPVEKKAEPDAAKAGENAEEKPGRAVSPAVKLEISKEGAVADGKAKDEKKDRPGRRGAGKGDRERGAKALAGKSEEELRKGLARTRAAHEKAVNKVNNTDAMMVKLGKDAAAQEEEAKKQSAEVEKAKAAFAEAKKKHAVMEKEHNSAHQQEENIKKMVAAIEAELKKRSQVAVLEKEAEELRKKAEALRKKAEKLKE